MPLFLSHFCFHYFVTLDPMVYTSGLYLINGLTLTMGMCHAIGQIYVVFLFGLDIYCGFYQIEHGLCLVLSYRYGSG